MKTHLPDEIWIGREGEQYSRSITFDISVELSMWGNATPTLIYVRPGEKVAYPATTTLTDGILTWIPDGFATAIRGARGFIQIVFTESADETVSIGKSKVMRMQICESLNTSAEPPEPWESWIEDLLDAAAQATTAAENATEAAQDATDAAADARSAVQEAEATVSALNTRVTEVENELDSAERDIAGIEGKVTEIVGEVTAEGTTQVRNVQNEGTTQVDNVSSEGTTQIGLVGAEGTRQIGLVTDAGTTQIGLIETKINTFAGIEILDEGESPQHESTEVTLTPDAEDIDQIPQIDDTQLSSVDTWSSNKISKDIEDAKTVDVTLIGTLADYADGINGIPLKKFIVDIDTERTSLVVTATRNNRFDKATKTDGMRVDDKTGEIITSTNYTVSDYIDVSDLESVLFRFPYAISSAMYLYGAFYNANQTFISDSGIKRYFSSGNISVSYDIPVNAKYVRISLPKTRITDNTTFIVTSSNDIEDLTYTFATITDGNLDVLSGILHDNITGNDYEFTPFDQSIVASRMTITCNVGSMTLIHSVDTKTYIDEKIAELRALIEG